MKQYFQTSSSHRKSEVNHQTLLQLGLTWLLIITSVMVIVSGDYFDNLNPSNPNSCPLPRIRRAWTEYTSQEKSDWVRVVNATKYYNVMWDGKLQSLYDYFAYIHDFNAGTWHGSAFFLPVHRLFLWEFESALQFIARTVSFSPALIFGNCPTVPYWPWEYDTTVTGSTGGPNNSPLFDGGYIGPRPNPSAKTYEVTQGEFSNWLTPTLWNRFCAYPSCRDPTQYPKYGPANYNLKRYFSSSIVFQLDPTQIMNTIVTYPKFSTFRTNAEGGSFHGNQHIWVGFEMSDMKSPADPIFFMHHCQIDRIWAIWQDCYDYENVSSSQITSTMYSGSTTYKTRLDDAIPFTYNQGQPEPFAGFNPTPRQVYGMGNANKKGFDGMYFRYGTDSIVNSVSIVGGKSVCPLNSQWTLVNQKPSTSKRDVSYGAGNNDSTTEKHDKNRNHVENLIQGVHQRAVSRGKKGAEGLGLMAQWICKEKVTKLTQPPEELIKFLEMNGVKLFTLNTVCHNVSDRFCLDPKNKDRPCCIKEAEEAAEAAAGGGGEEEEVEEEQVQSINNEEQQQHQVEALEEGYMVVPKWAFATVVGVAAVLFVAIIVAIFAGYVIYKRNRIVLFSS